MIIIQVLENIYISKKKLQNWDIFIKKLTMKIIKK